MCDNIRVPPVGSVPSRENSRWFASIMQAASACPEISARAASRSPPMWSPCRPTPTSKRCSVKSCAGHQPAGVQVRAGDQGGLR